MIKYQYILYVDEAGDDKVQNLKPEHPTGNSEWLCLGGYLVRTDSVDTLDGIRDRIVCSIGGTSGQPLHFRNYKPKNMSKVCKELATHSARVFVVCSLKKTMLGHRNERAEAAGSYSSNQQYLYNFVVRLLLERATEFVESDAKSKGIAAPKLKILMATRRGHHFGHFKAYVLQLKRQAQSRKTFLDTREVRPDVLDYDLIDRMPASKSSGLQLADVVVSSVFQSIEQLSKGYRGQPAKHLKSIVAGKRYRPSGKLYRRNEGLTLFHTSKAPKLLSTEQAQFFQHFGFDFKN